MNDQKLGNIEEAAPHSIFSAIVDLYLAEMYIGATASLALYFIKIDFLGEFLLFLGIILLIVIIIYHSIYAEKISWLSPGEIIGGKSKLNSQKVWINPYGINRTGLFIICILSLLSFRNTGAISGSLTSLTEIAVFYLITILITYSIILIGKGKLTGIAIIDVMLLLAFGISILVDNKIMKFSGYYSIVTFIIFSIIGLYYHKARQKLQNNCL